VQNPDTTQPCSCCSLYPYEVDDDPVDTLPGALQWQDHPYLAPRVDGNLGRAV
jgi:hypothetical protein